jgi:hypothetical protein
MDISEEAMVWLKAEAIRLGASGASEIIRRLVQEARGEYLLRQRSVRQRDDRQQEDLSPPF